MSVLNRVNGERIKGDVAMKKTAEAVMVAGALLLWMIAALMCLNGCVFTTEIRHSDKYREYNGRSYRTYSGASYMDDMRAYQPAE